MAALACVCASTSSLQQWPSTLCARGRHSRGIFASSSNLSIGCFHKFNTLKCRREHVLLIPAFSNQSQRNISTSAGKNSPEKSLLSIVEIDRLIDKLRVASEQQLLQDVAENILSFDTSFWMRLAARTEQCESEDDKEDFKELTNTLMTLVERFVHKTTDKIDSATDILKRIIQPLTKGNEEIVWPPEDPNSLLLVKEELDRREEDCQLDEGFLSEVNAQLRQAKADGDKPGLVAIFQKVLQLYASKILSRRSYAMKGGNVIRSEEFLETIIKASEYEWNKLLFKGLIYGGGTITIEELNDVVNKRIERTLMRTVGGSYQQRVVCEYLKEIQERAHNVAEAFQKQQALEK